MSADKAVMFCILRVVFLRWEFHVTVAGSHVEGTLSGVSMMCYESDRRWPSPAPRVKLPFPVSDDD